MQTITINGKTVAIGNDNQLSGIQAVFMAKSVRGWKGNTIDYKGLSKQDAQTLIATSSKAIDGILTGLQAITGLMAFVDYEEVGTDNVQNALWAINGLAELGASVKDEFDNLRFYANS